MERKNRETLDEFEIDPSRTLRAVVGKLWLIALVSVACGLLVFAVTSWLVPPEYRSGAMFYVINHEPDSDGISSGDLSASRSLVESCIVILNTRETLNAVIEAAGSDLTSARLADMLSAGAVNGTEILRVAVTSPDPLEAERLAKAVAVVLPKQIGGIMEADTLKLVESPTAAAVSGHGKEVLLAVLAGFLLSIGGVVICALLDTTIRSVDDISGVCTYPILASVTEGSGEAYRLLRAKLLHLLPEAGVIGICGCDGRTQTAAELAHALSRKKNAMLIDCNPELNLETLKREHDYILLDLPPAGEIADDLTLAGQWDGIVLTVRRDVCTREALKDAVEKFEFFDAEILGIVFHYSINPKQEGSVTDGQRE